MKLKINGQEIDTQEARRRLVEIEEAYRREHSVSARTEAYEAWCDAYAEALLDAVEGKSRKIPTLSITSRTYSTGKRLLRDVQGIVSIKALPHVAPSRKSGSRVRVVDKDGAVVLDRSLKLGSMLSYGAPGILLPGKHYIRVRGNVELRTI